MRQATYLKNNIYRRHNYYDSLVRAAEQHPIKERGGTTSTEEAERSQGQTSFHCGEFPVVKQHHQVLLQANHSCFRAVLSELKLNADEWPEVVSMVQERPEQVLIDKAEHEDAYAILHRKRGDDSSGADVERQCACQRASRLFKALKLMEVEKLSKIMTEIHAQVDEKATRDRKTAIQKHNDKTNMRSPNFHVGDYVLVAEHRKSGVSKLQVKWKGPRRIASVESDYVFVVVNLLTEELNAANATPLRLYRIRDSTTQRRWLRSPSTTTISCTSCRRYSARDRMNKRYFMSCISMARLLSRRGHLGTVLCCGCGCSRDGEEDESHDDPDMVREMRSL
jgi:hypothetical protein